MKCRSKKKTPDLGASQVGRSVFCEVKTIDISEDEAKKRSRMRRGAFVVGSTRPNVDNSFLMKLRVTLTTAVKQLDAADPERRARRMIFTMLHFDDWLGEYQAQYIAQIDEHLLQQPVDGAELVFCLRNNIFEHSFTMKSATILPE